MFDFKEEVRKRLARLNLEPNRESAIVEEVAQHMEDRCQELLTQGKTRQAAEDVAMAELSEGNLLALELRRTERRIYLEAVPPGAPAYRSVIANLWKDVRLGVRALRLNPSFSVIAVLSLALGIGANTSIFQLLDAVRLRALPVKAPNELVEIRTPNMRGRTGSMRGGHQELSNPLWEQLRDHQEAFSGIMAWNVTSFNLSTEGEMRFVPAMLVSGDFFNVLGVRPELGRVFTSADDQHGCGAPGVVISHSFWEKEYGGKPSAIGSTLKLQGHPVEVIGVTPPDFFGMDVGRSFAVAVPLCAEQLIVGEHSVFTRRDGWWLAAVGRLKPGWSADKATAQLESISPGIFQATLPRSYNPETAKRYLAAKLGAFPAGSGLSNLRHQYEGPLLLLLVIAGTVLLIACANLANLMFARASARERETAVRLALGASRLRLMQQLLVEGLLLAAAGAVAGILLAQILTRVLVSFLSTQFSQIFLDLHLDWRVLSFTACLAVLTCLLFGLYPAIRASGTHPASAIKAGSRGTTASRERFGLRRVLVITQVSLSLVLLVSALLFVRTFQNLLALDAGFQQGGIVIANVDLEHLNLPQGNRIAFKKDLLARVRAIPGVESAAETSLVPVSGSGWNDFVHTDASGHEVRELANFNRISPEYFKTMGTAILQGRDISEADTLNSPTVVVVNETFVRKVLQGASPVGKTFRVEVAPGKPEPVYEIIGTVKDTKYNNLREEFPPIAYVASGQDTDPDMQPALMVRSSIALDALTSSLTRTIRETSPAISFQFSVYKTAIRDTLLRERLMASLSGFFGFLAAVLATIGLYGVISYMVVRRRNEIGIRMALGASRSRVLGLIMREAAVLLAIGLVVGSGLALLVAKTASGMLFGLNAHDPVTLGMAAALLATVAAIASYLPAHRAAQLDPLDALREE